MISPTLVAHQLQARAYDSWRLPHNPRCPERLSRADGTWGGGLRLLHALRFLFRQHYCVADRRRCLFQKSAWQGSIIDEPLATLSNRVIATSWLNHRKGDNSIPCTTEPALVTVEVAVVVDDGFLYPLALYHGLGQGRARSLQKNWLS